MSEKIEQWEASKEDIDFLAKLNIDLEGLDFDYERSNSGKTYDEGSKCKQSIISKIKGVEDKDLQEVAMCLYDLHVMKNNGKLAVKWEWVLED
jgi:hypothetical protein